MGKEAYRLAAQNPLAAKCLLWFCRHSVPFLGRLVRIVLNSDFYLNLRGKGKEFDPYLPHPYGIVVHSLTKMGRGVTLMQQVTLGGQRLGVNEAPVLGDRVYVGAGAKVLGGIVIGDDVVIGANAVVTRDVPAGHTVVGANRLLTPAQGTLLLSSDAAAHPSPANGEA